MRLLLIRHAESANNRLFTDTGGSEGRHADPPLTELGHAQAQALADFAGHDPTFQAVTHLYCSLTTRAVQTARPLAQALGLSVQGLSLAYEAGGLFQRDGTGPEAVASAVPGRTHADLLTENPALLWPPELPPHEPWAGGFEARGDEVLAARAAQVVQGLQAAHGGGEGGESGEGGAAEDVVALVTHGHFTQFLLRHFTGHGQVYFTINNTGTTLLHLPTAAGAAQGEWPVLGWVNRHDHLRPEGLSV